MQRFVSAFGLLIALVACGGGGGSSLPTTGGGGTASPTPSPTPTVTTAPPAGPTASATVAVPSIAGAFGMPALPGYSGTISLASATSGAGTNLQVVVQATSPGGLPVIQARHRAAAAQSNQGIFFYTFTFASNVTMSGLPGFSLTLPSSVSTNGTFSLWFYDPTNAQSGWQVLAGPVTASGSTLTFAPGSTAQNFAANTAYQFAIVFAPAATPPPTATPVPTPASVASLVTATFAPPGGAFPVSIAVGSDNNLWVTASTLFVGGNGYIAKLSTAGAFTSYTLPGTPTRQPSYITRGPDQALWFTESNGNSIGRIDTAGNIAEYAAFNNGGPIVTGSDGNLWFPYGAAVYGFSPTTHTIVGTASLPVGTSVNQLLSNPATGAIVVEAGNAASSADSIFSFAPGPAPTATQITSSAAPESGSLAMGGTNLYATSVPAFSNGVQSIMIFAQSNYAQTTIPLPLSAGAGGPMVVAPNGDLFLGARCGGPNNCPQTFDVSQVTSSGVFVGYGPRNQHYQLDESPSFSSAVFGPDGNAWFLYQDSGIGLVSGVAERLIPNAH